MLRKFIWIEIHKMFKLFFLSKCASAYTNMYQKIPNIKKKKKKNEGLCGGEGGGGSLGIGAQVSLGPC